MSKKTTLIIVFVAVIIFTIVGLIIGLNNEKQETFTNMKKEDIKLDDDKINVYIFYGLTCPHCEELHEMLEENKEYKKYYNLYSFEVWMDKYNQKFMKEVANILDIKINGVPFIIIGEDTFSGYSSSNKDKILDSIKSNYENKDFKDLYELLND